MISIKCAAFAIAAGVISLCAQASPVTYDFGVNGGTSGPLAGVVSSGSFTFDSSIAASGGVYTGRELEALSFSWDGIHYTAATANTGALQSNGGGAILTGWLFGTSCGPASCSIPAPPAATDGWVLTNTSFSYLVAGDTQVRNGTFTFLGPAAAVPEPSSLVLLGIGLLPLLRWGAASARRSSSRQIGGCA